MTADEFDRLIRATRSVLEAVKEPPEKLERLLHERLLDDLQVHDHTVLEAVYAWRQYESATDWQAPHPYPRTTGLIRALMPYGRQHLMLLAQLSAIHGDILREFGRLPEAASEYARAVDTLHGLHLDLDTKRMSAMVALGQLLLSQGNKHDAEKLFLDVLSYPWYLVMEGEEQALLRHDYLSAGLGLINCRRGDPAGLREIFFVPAAQGELQPALQQAIDEAQAKQG